MANDLTVRLQGATETGLVLPDEMTQAQWKHMGERLGMAERIGNSVGWWIGDWWLYGESHYGSRKAVVSAPGWRGPNFQTCMNAASVCRAFESYRRREVLPYTHHAEVAKLPPPVADRLLLDCETALRETGKLPASRLLRQEVKRQRRDEREIDMAARSEQASRTLGTRLYGVIYADPPWQFNPYSETTGMDRSADNHYPTMHTDDIAALKPPAADDCALFLWATPPMLLDAVDVLEAWGFEYRTHFVWFKPNGGTGYWTRSHHELLLVGVRGEVPAPAPGDQFPSVIEAMPGEHSAKPAMFAEMIEEMFPNASLLEMFARYDRAGWDAWGNEVLEGEAAE